MVAVGLYTLGRCFLDGSHSLLRGHLAGLQADYENKELVKSISSDTFSLNQLVAGFSYWILIESSVEEFQRDESGLGERMSSGLRHHDPERLIGIAGSNRVGIRRDSLGDVVVDAVDAFSEAETTVSHRNDSQPP